MLSAGHIERVIYPAVTAGEGGSRVDRSYWNQLAARPDAAYVNNLRSQPEINRGSPDGNGDPIVYDPSRDAALIWTKAGGNFRSQKRSYKFSQRVDTGTALLTWTDCWGSGWRWLDQPDPDYLFRQQKTYMIGSPDIGGSGRWMTFKHDMKQGAQRGTAPSVVAYHKITLSGPGRLVYGPGTREGNGEELMPLTRGRLEGQGWETHRDRWVRTYVFLDGLNANSVPPPDDDGSFVPTWCKASAWMVEEGRSPDQLYDDLLVGLDGQGIHEFVLQFNTSVTGRPTRDRKTWVCDMALLTGLTKHHAEALLSAPLVRQGHE